MLPRYNNNVATLRKQRCHATQTILPRYNNVEKRTEDELEDKLEDRLVSVSAMPPCTHSFIIISLLPNQNL